MPSETDPTPTLQQLAEQVAAMIEPKPVKYVGDAASLMSSFSGKGLWWWSAVEVAWVLSPKPDDPRFIAKVETFILKTHWMQMTLHDGSVLIEIGKYNHPALALVDESTKARSLLSAVAQMEVSK